MTSGWHAPRFTVRRKTMRKRWQAKLKQVKWELRWRRHHSIPEQGAYLASVVRGHAQYYGLPGNGKSITMFRRAVGRLWKRSLGRRSQKGRVTWERMERLIQRWIPLAHVCQPNPYDRLRVMTRGRSPVR